MRPGRKEDLPGVLELWRDDVRGGRRDCVPGDGHLSRLMSGFDWEAQSRTAERPDGDLEGAVLVWKGAGPFGTVAMVDASAASERSELRDDLTRWGLNLSRAAGAAAAQVWRGRGHTQGLDRLGLKNIRPWLRMDRSLDTESIKDSIGPVLVAGYEMRDGAEVRAGTWAEVHNLAFADHWRFSPRTEDELMTGRAPALCLLAVAHGGSPAALAVCQIEVYGEDPRPQPVGVLSSVGTLPEHRRRGLASWLVAEALLRLHHAGARHASLYVDGWNPTRAFDVYRKLGFELAFETEVWEATFR